MARPQRCRRICAMPAHTRFSPESGEIAGEVTLTLDEYEAIRLMDLEGRTHEQCAEIMQVSRTTVTEIYASARRKLADAVVNGRLLTLSGGSVRLCERAGQCDHSACGASGCPSGSDSSKEAVL